jgi:soluble lytic murein transglycosylase-like protein
MTAFRRFYRIKIIITIVVTLLALSPTAFASQLGDKQAELENINARIKATKSKQDNAAKRQAKISQQIQQSNKKMVQIQIRLNSLQRELNNIIAGKRKIEAKLIETQKRLDEMQAKLTRAKERLALRKEVFNKRLVSSYKNGEQSVIAVLLSSENFSDLMTRIALLRMIAEQDGRLVLEMKQLTANITNEITQIEAAKKAIDKQRLSLIAEKKRTDAKVSSIIAQQDQLDTEMSRQQQLYAQIQQEKEQLAQAEGQLKASSNKIAEQIGALTYSPAKAVSTPTDLKNLAEKYASKYGIPTKLFFALITQESGWNYRAVSRTGAIGLTQVMPFNVIAMGYDLESFKNSPSEQLEAGARYLSQQYMTFGRWDLALAAYNAGPGAVLRYGGIPPYTETINYVSSILSMAEQ